MRGAGSPRPRAFARLAGAAIVAVIACPSGQPSPDPPLAWAVCAGVADDTELVATGELRLHRDLLAPAGPTPELVREAVALQLRYAFAVSHNDPGARTTWTPDGPPRRVDVLATADVAYGKDITLDWPADPELRPESDYVRRALARGRLAADDPALAITWRAHLRVARCDADGEAADALRVPVPHDPYLFYWAIDAADRVAQVYLGRRVVTFPCAAAEIADYAHPEYLWYYWQPRRDGCAALLRSPRDLGEVALRVTASRRPSGDLGPWRAALARALDDRPLRVALVFGYLNHQVPRPDPAHVRAALQTDGDLAPEFEWGTRQYVQFIRRLGELLDERTFTAPVRDPDLTAAIGGTLRRSGRRVELIAHLTETDYLAPARYPARHAPLLLTALGDADLILYAGHSGLGLNFSRARLEQHASPAVVADALARSPARLVAFIGCDTYAYFGDDLAAGLVRGDRSAQDILFVYTGNSTAETADSALQILHTVDCLLAGEHGTIGPGACDFPAPGSPRDPGFLLYDHPR